MVPTVTTAPYGQGAHTVCGTQLRFTNSYSAPTTIVAHTIHSGVYVYLNILFLFALQACTKLAMDFMTAQCIDYCVKHKSSLRMLPRGHQGREDKLQVSIKSSVQFLQYPVRPSKSLWYAYICHRLIPLSLQPSQPVQQQWKSILQIVLCNCLR